FRSFNGRQIIRLHLFLCDSARNSARRGIFARFGIVPLCSQCRQITLACGFPSMDRVGTVARIHYRVALEYTRSFPSADVHDYFFSNALVAHVPRHASTKIMEQEPRIDELPWLPLAPAVGAVVLLAHCGAFSV